MSRADALFLQNCRDILDHGVWTQTCPSVPIGRTVPPPTL